METIIIAIVSSGAFSAIVTSIISLIQKRNEKDNDVIIALQTILHDRIKYLSKAYIEDGEIEAEDLEDLLRMHEVYHSNLDGNGFLDNLISKVKALPVKIK